MSFDRQRIKDHATDLAAKGVYIGTSSWKYSGWCNQLYDEQRYIFRGKFAESRFEKNCLSEYAEVFKTVCVDGAFYRFPDERYLSNLVSAMPNDFLFAFKVTDEITTKHFPNLPRHGIRAGKPNENFLNAELFVSAFLKPCESFKRNVGLLMFEFSKFYASDYAHGRDFVSDLDKFLSELPRGWNYGVEIRNKTFLQADYFACLAKHHVTHIFNSWTEMPPINEQMSLSQSRTSPNVCGARFLLKPGRKYQDAVDTFSPYKETKEMNQDARSAGAALIREGIAAGPQRKTFIFVNNRLEGNALLTIEAMLDLAEPKP